jgi:hypothetical protein
VCGKYIVGQSLTKLDKVDMFSKEVIKKQSWQSWCIFIFIFEYSMQAKLAKLAKFRYESFILGKVGKVRNTFGLIWLLLKIGKVGDIFGSIWLLFRLGKVGKVEI